MDLVKHFSTLQDLYHADRHGFVAMLMNDPDFDAAYKAHLADSSDDPLMAFILSMRASVLSSDWTGVHAKISLPPVLLDDTVRLDTVPCDVRCLFLAQTITLGAAVWALVDWYDEPNDDGPFSYTLTELITRTLMIGTDSVIRAMSTEAGEMVVRLDEYKAAEYKAAAQAR